MSLDMPVVSVTTAAVDVFTGDVYLETLAFRNGSASGIIYIRNKRLSLTEVASTSYEYSLSPGDSIGFSKLDGSSMRGPWRAISDTGGGVNLEVLPGYNETRRV